MTDQIPDYKTLSGFDKKTCFNEWSMHIIKNKNGNQR